MLNPIEIDKYPVKDVLKILLQDKTTGKNIIFATDMYSEYGYSERNPMTEAAITGLCSFEIQPRVFKAQSEQNLRTRKKAEVFTPTWICNMMNNHLDSDWFGRDDVFNRMDSEHNITVVEGSVEFPKKKTWQKYVDSRRLEITCGEAPYLVSRYDTTTGESIPIKERIGLLDRKLRIVGENTTNEDDWLFWTIRAFQSIYGYEFQGDNILIARINLLVTFCDYLEDKWHRKATKEEIKKFANIIAWNIWQMDGLTDTVPIGAPEEQYTQMSLLDSEEPATPVDCRIQDWRDKRPKVFKKIKGKNERGVTMKFDYVIGNPPYQEEQISTDTDGSLKNYAPPVYHYFMDASYSVGEIVELIHPARFLFNAGSTPKAWNDKMLADEHFKVLFYENDSQKIFAKEIKGGIVISLHNNNADFGAIETFSQYPEVNSILKTVTRSNGYSSIDSIVFSRTSYRLTEKVHTDYPNAKNSLSAGHLYDMSSNIFQRLPFLFRDTPDENGGDYVKVLGRDENSRTYKYIQSQYINEGKNLFGYKLFIPQASGRGDFGETLGALVIGEPNVASTETFLSIGNFSTETEASNCKKYISSKFARCLLSVLKVTQIGNKPVYRYIPLQDFTANSDINWSLSIPEIDQQLYKKYGLTQEEIDFIESHVKEMT